MVSLNISQEITFQGKPGNFIIELLHKDIIYTYLPEISNKIASKLQQLLCVPVDLLGMFILQHIANGVNFLVLGESSLSGGHS